MEGGSAGVGQGQAQEELTVFKAFEHMALKPALLRGIHAYGYERPSAVQQRALVPITRGRDVIAQAQAGVGKTAMLAIAVLQLIDHTARATQAMVLSPTRELAAQTQRLILALGEYLTVSCHAVMGGRSLTEDIRRLDAGCQIVSGTPGRIFDMLRRRHLQTRGLRVLVLDEADELLAQSFKEQLYDIYRYVPSAAQVVLVSATFPHEVLDMARRFMTTPVEVLVRRDELTLEGVRQYFVNCEQDEWKLPTLIDMWDSLTVTQAVIFANTKTTVDFLCEKLRSAHFVVASMHGDMPQSERDAVMGDFRLGAARVLITTDVFARGVDVAAVSLVVNFDLPVSREVYLHRVGRSGRFGKKGVAVTLVTKETLPALRAIEAYYATQIEEMPSKVDTTLA